MKLNIYSVYDQAAKAYTAPFFLHNDGLAIRAFQDNVNAEQENNISKHPEHFSLFKLGEFDDQKGVITKLDVNVHLASAIELKNPTNEEELIQEIKSLKAYIQTMPQLKEELSK